MLPSNLINYSDAELLRFVEDRHDPLIAELCRRVEGLEFLTKMAEMEEERDLAVERYELYAGEVEEKQSRINELETLLRENNISVPP